jgi:hypothetical protein
VAIDANERVGRLRQDQFVYEGERVLDVVLQGRAILTMQFDVGTVIT